MNKVAVALLLLITVALPAQASWVLNGDKSTVSFISTKAANIAEIHSFGMLQGAVSGEGEVHVAINLASVKTGIDIRDERMREMLFDTESFGNAMMTATVDGKMLSGLESGDSAMASVEGELALHGKTAPMTFDVVITRTDNGGLLVSSQRPVVVNAPVFGLAEGVEALRAIAGLPSISTAVPVSFILSFDPAQ